MQATMTPGICTQPTVSIPPSKSMAHRAIICAALAQGESLIHHVDYSDDILTTIDGMRKLGARIELDGSDVRVWGIPDFHQLKTDEIFCKESGSTLRFFIPIFSLTGQRVRFTGQNRLLKRPQTVYEQLFQAQGLVYSHTEERIEIEGALKPGEVTLRGDISSQFISGLLFALVCCSGDSRLHIEPPFESRSYVELTLQMLEDFGVHAYFEDELTLRIPGGQRYRACETTVESDYSQLGFYAALGCINHEIRCLGLRPDSRQGDRQILDIVRAMGGNVEVNEKEIIFRPAALKGSVIDMQNCPDLGPILMVLASFAQGETKMINAARLRYKESDRIEAMETELRKVGVQIHSTESEVWIEGPTPWQGGVTVSGHQDHRIVMALAIGATMAEGPITIEGAQAIAKSYPGFFADLRSLGIEIKEN